MTTPYVPQTWINGEPGNTPLNDTRLNHIEAGLLSASQTAIAAAALIPAAGLDLLGWMNSFVAPFSSVQAYREPTGPELTNLLAGIAFMPTSTTAAAALLTPLGFTVTTGIDAVTKRAYALAVCAAVTDDKAWGAYLFDLSKPIDAVIGAPHPVSDQYSELLAFAHWQARPGQMLMIAGAHASATSGLADVTTHTASMYHNVAAAYATKRVIQCHWQGYPDASAPGLTHVIAAGAANVGTAIIRAGLELKGAGFTIGQGWDGSGSGLTGLIAASNVQAIDAATKQASFINVAVNLTSRGDSVVRSKTSTALAKSDLGQMANADGAIAAGTTLFPQNVGTTNTVGTSPYSARADHVHKERQATLDRITALEGRGSSWPSDYGYAGWSGDPAAVATTITPTAGVLYLQRIPIRVAGQLISRIHIGVTATGTLTSGQNFLALYNSAGARLGLTADITTALGTTGELTASLTAAQTIAAADFVWVGMLLNGSGMPTISRGGPTLTGLGNSQLATTTKRFAQYSTGQTATPSSITLASLANTASPPWMAVS